MFAFLLFFTDRTIRKELISLKISLDNNIYSLENNKQLLIVFQSQMKNLILMRRLPLPHKNNNHQKIYFQHFLQLQVNIFARFLILLIFLIRF